MEKSFQISRKLLYIIFAVLSLVTLILGYFLYNHRNRVIKEEKYQSLSAIAELKMNQVLAWREELISDGKIFTKVNLFIDEMEDYMEGRGDPEYIFNRLNVEKDIRNFLSYAILDRNLNIKYADSAFVYNPGLIPADIFTRKEPRLSNIYSDKNRSKCYIDLYIPLIKGNKIISLLILQQDPDIYLFPLIKVWPTPSQTSESLIFAVDGDSLIYLNRLKHSDEKPFTFKLPIKIPDLPAAMLARGITGVVEGKDYRGVSVLADLRVIPGSEWFLVTKVDIDEVFAVLHEQLLITIFIISIVLITLYFAALHLWNKNNLWILEKLYKAENEKKQLLEKSLMEKEFFVREIHHRVKNNLQIISSIINLHTEKIDDESSKQVFHDINNRIHIFTKVHQKLYSNKVDTVNSYEYLTDLINLIKCTYHDQKVEMHSNISPLELKFEKAIYLGIIVNEIISNSYKHAFENGKAGIIQIRLLETGSNTVILTISDNGRGLPDDAKMGLGLMLIENLSEQIDGKMEIRKKGGTEYIFVFENLLDKKSENSEYNTLTPH